MTRFKEMSMEEQVDTIEQLAQEALRVRDESRAIEATEAQRRGMLLLEESQRVIERLQDDPMLDPLIEPLRVTLTDTTNFKGEKIGSETILLEGTTDPENPRVLSPQARSLVIIPSQQEIQRTSGEIGVSNTLFDLITIYDDEESSEGLTYNSGTNHRGERTRGNICSNSQCINSKPSAG
jgi:hypothetical protein